MGAIAGQLALIVASIFAGAAIYVSLVHQNSRMVLGDEALLAEWKQAYARGYSMQAPLAAVGFLLGVFAWFQTGAVLQFAGGLLLMANWPYTMLVLTATNRQLEQFAPQDAGPQSRALIERWGRLHDVRSLLGLAAVVSFFLAAVL
jgi:hypothetical protein